MVEIEYVDTEILGLDPEFFVLWLKDVCSKEGHNLGDLSLVFCSDSYLLQVNQEYLNHDYYTDIITFDYTNDNLVSGDLFISIDRVRDNANSYNVEFLNELQRVVVHGVLHLLGYKDKSENDQKLMRQKENEYLKIVPRET